jgi:hypothetical protein
VPGAEQGRGRDNEREKAMTDDDREDEFEEEPDERPRRRRRPPEDPMDDPAMRFVLPVNTSVWAIAASYMGLISVLCFPAPFALILGIVALVHLKRNSNLHGKGRAIFAIVLGAIGSLPIPFVLIALITKQ